MLYPVYHEISAYDGALSGTILVSKAFMLNDKNLQKDCFGLLSQIMNINCIIYYRRSLRLIGRSGSP